MKNLFKSLAFTSLFAFSGANAAGVCGDSFDRCEIVGSGSQQFTSGHFYAGINPGRAHLLHLPATVRVESNGSIANATDFSFSGEKIVKQFANSRLTHLGIFIGETMVEDVIIDSRPERLLSLEDWKAEKRARAGLNEGWSLFAPKATSNDIEAVFAASSFNSQQENLAVLTSDSRTIYLPLPLTSNQFTQGGSVKSKILDLAVTENNVIYALVKRPSGVFLRSYNLNGKLDNSFQPSWDTLSSAGSLDDNIFNLQALSRVQSFYNETTGVTTVLKDEVEYLFRGRIFGHMSANGAYASISNRDCFLLFPTDARSEPLCSFDTSANSHPLEVGDTFNFGVLIASFSTLNANASNLLIDDDVYYLDGAPVDNNPGTEDPGTQTPVVDNPGTEDPGTQTPVVENPVVNETSDGGLITGIDGGDSSALLGGVLLVGAGIHFLGGDDKDGGGGPVDIWDLLVLALCLSLVLARRKNS